jgi:hypothetical protein
MITISESLEDSSAEDRAVRDYIAELARLADQAAFDGLHGLQDACLVLMESLSASSPGEMVTSKAGLSAIINAWPLLVRAYRQAPLVATGKIMEFLRHPALQLPLSDEEFAIIEAGLLAEDGAGGADEPDAAYPGRAGLPAEGFRKELEIAGSTGDDSTVATTATGADSAETGWLVGDIGEEVDELDVVELEDAGIPVVSAWEDGEIVEPIGNDSTTASAEAAADEWLVGGAGEEMDESDAVDLKDAGIPAEGFWEEVGSVEPVEDDSAAAAVATEADSTAVEWLVGEEANEPDSMDLGDADLPASVFRKRWISLS